MVDLDLFLQRERLITQPRVVLGRIPCSVLLIIIHHVDKICAGCAPAPLPIFVQSSAST
jgi:hypothetical protein